jgi:hypothetical protein
MASRKALLIIAAASVAIAVGALLLLPAATAWPNNHVVGETDGWQLGVDYNYWACWVNTGIPHPVRLAYQPPASSTFLSEQTTTSNQPIVLVSQNKSAPAINHQPNEQAASRRHAR